MTYRLKYSKQGLIRFISHLDCVRVWQRAFRRAGLPVEMSRGFSPHPLISFGPPLPVGIESRCELLDVTLKGAVTLRDLKERLSSTLPEGMEVQSVRPVSKRSGSLCSSIDRASYEVDLGGGLDEEMKEKISAFGQEERAVVARKTKRGVSYRDIKPRLKQLKLGKGEGGRLLLRFTAVVGDTGNLNCFDVLRAICRWPEEKVRKLPITRTALFSSGQISQRTSINGQADTDQRGAAGKPRGHRRGWKTTGNPHRTRS